MKTSQSNMVFDHRQNCQILKNEWHCCSLDKLWLDQFWANLGRNTPWGLRWSLSSDLRRLVPWWLIQGSWRLAQNLSSAHQSWTSCRPYQPFLPRWWPERCSKSRLFWRIGLYQSTQYSPIKFHPARKLCWPLKTCLKTFCPRLIFCFCNTGIYSKISRPKICKFYLHWKLR